MFTLNRCTRPNLCIDCDDPDCRHAKDPGADCPKYTCDSEDCDRCEFIKEFQEDMRKEFKQNDSKH